MLSIPHLIIIFVVALVVFGPEKLPELARNLGKVMAEFRRHTGDLRSTFEGHLRDLERESDARRIAAPTPAPSPAPVAAPQPAPASPGTVPSNPPNAAALAPQPETPRVEDVPDPDLRRPDARKDPGNDPYLIGADFTATEPAQQPEPSESEKVPERVTDGDPRPS